MTAPVATSDLHEREGGAPDLDPARKQAPLRLGRVVVLGLGKTGHALLGYLSDQPEGRIDQLAVIVDDAFALSDPDAATLAELGVRVLRPRDFGPDSDLSPVTVDEAFDLCVASPGFSPSGEPYRLAERLSAELVSEPEFAWRESAATSSWVGITGTNGKTTTTALTAHVFAAAGERACAVGNIGTPCIDAIRTGDTDRYVAELSSYQLHSTGAMTLDAACLINVTPDHLAWHGSFESYAEDKMRICASALDDPARALVFDAREPEVRARMSALASELTAAGHPHPRSFELVGEGDDPVFDHAVVLSLADGVLSFGREGASEAICRTDELSLAGAHNHSNALLAAGVCLACGLTVADVAAGLTSFEALPHRVEPCGEVAGVRYYNDSKATNVDATVKAIAAFDPVRPIVLLGGDDKGTDLTELVDVCREHARAVVLFGASRPRFAEAFRVLADEAAAASDSTDGIAAATAVLEADHLADALEAATAFAHDGDVVILSPACASFDEFDSFEHRGEVFKSLVAGLAARG